MVNVPGYRDVLLMAMREFAGSHFSPDQFDHDLGDLRRPPVFKREHQSCNLIVPLESDLAAKIRQAVPVASRHRWFGSMMSSQALAQSVLGGVIAAGRLDVIATVAAEDGTLAFENLPGCIGTLEKEVTWLGEREGRGTNVDAWFERADYRIAVECKLTEQEFGACSRPNLPSGHPDRCDGAYSVQMQRTARCSLTEQGIAYWSYIPEVLAWHAGEDHLRCPARYTYQLVRNLLAVLVSRGAVAPHPGHIAVSYDARNPAFHAARVALDQTTLALLDRSHLRVVTWQAVIAALAEDAQFDYLVEDLEAKYGLA